MRPFPVLVTVSLGLLACGEPAPPEQVIRPVRYQPVFATGGARVRTFSGAARSAVESPLSFRVGGTVRRLPVGLGAQISAGDLVAALDPQDFRLRVQQAEASLRQAEARATNASASYSRVRLMYENRNASRSDLDAARSAAESADAAVEAAANVLELRRLELGYAELRAPFDGTISAVHADVNQNVRPGQPIATATSGDRLDVRISVPEVLIGQIAEGQAARVTFDALEEDTLAARVSEVGVASTGLATTYPVTVRLEESRDGLRAGMAAEVAFTFRATDERERFYVPAVAVGEDRSGRHVFVVAPTDSGFGVVHRRAVRVGELTAEGLEVLEGINDGDLLVTAGVTKIVDGMVVRLPGPSSASAGRDGR